MAVAGAVADLRGLLALALGLAAVVAFLVVAFAVVAFAVAGTFLVAGAFLVVALAFCSKC